jgi:UDP-2-acetamido-2-deoxy-ribo-hexuluronate aminotransferase
MNQVMNIQMVDTLGQYRHIQQEIDDAVQEVVRSGQYINGPVVQGFAEELGTFLGGAHVIPCANGTDALQIALMALDLQPGDEVITPSFTYISTVEVISLLRLKPVFVEVDPQTFNMDPEQLEAALSERTRAIIPVHLFGQAADMAPILAFARKHGLAVVEDTAQAIGGSYTFPDGSTQKLGTIGDIGCTSFYPSKNLGAFGDGGAIFTRNEALAQKLQMICNHGSERRYFHDSIGVNSRLDAMQAAILRVKLRHLDAYNQARRTAANRYDHLLAEESKVATPVRADFSQHVFHQYTLKVVDGREKRDQLKAFLDERRIPSMIYYPVACHLQGGYRQYGYKKGDLPISERLTAEVISLPMHTELDEAQLRYITDHVKQGLHLT